MIEQRKARRFELKLPFELIRNGSVKTRHCGETKNLSSGGVLFEADTAVELGDPVEYFVTLPTPPDADLVRIRCLGKIVRRDKRDIAVTLERYEFVRESKSAASEEPEKTVRLSPRHKANMS